MKRSLSLLAMAVLCFVTWPVRADETPETQLEFVRKLRTRHYSNLALEYLEKLKKSAPPGMAPLLSLEAARTRVSLALEKEPEQRAPLFAQARGELEAFLKAHGTRPEAAEARVEVARLSALEGKAQLGVAFRQETREAQVAGAVKARQQFIDAGKELEAAAKQLEILQAKVASPKTAEDKLLKEKLGEAHLQILLDRGTNYLDQAETYIDQASDKTVRERAEVIEEAKKTLTKVADLDAEGPHSAMARAWLVKCYQLTDAPQEAAKQFKRVMNEKGSQARPGQRLAWSFYIQGLPRDPSILKEKNKKIIEEASGWLKEYAAYRNTPEGLGVRFELAKAQLTEAQAAKGAVATKLFAAAQKGFASLSAGESEFAPKANELSLSISVNRIKDIPLEKLKDFEDCFLKARYEVYLLQQAALKAAKADGPEREKADQERKTYLKNIRAAFRRALLLADDKTDGQKLTEARYFLTFVYLMSGDPYRAAVMGESTAHTRPFTKRSAGAAGYALEAYAAILGERNGNTEDNRQRMRKLADYVLKDRAPLWKNEPVSTQAHYQLAMVSLREKKYADTIDQLEQLPPSFTGYVYAQSQLALTAVAAAREAKSDAEKAALQDKALKALQRIPTLPLHTDAATAQMFFAAQLEQGNLLYTAAATAMQKGDAPQATKKFTEMDAFTTGLQQQFQKMDAKLSDEVRGKVAFALNSLKRLGEYGLASSEYRAGNYDKVLTLTEDAVKAVKAQDKGDGPIVLKDYKVTGGLLGLNLRAKVQKGKINEAKDLLPLLRRLQGENEVENDSTAVLQALVQEMRAQVKTLQEKGDRAQLDATVANFSAFLEELAKQSDTKALNSDRKAMLQNLFFLANCYGSLGKHDKAAGLYARIPEPKGEDGKKPDEKEIATYWFIQLQRARELRQTKQFPEAREALSKIPPAFRSLPVMQEEIYQLEDQDLYGTAINSWGKLMKNPSLVKKIGTDNEAKKLYFDSFYHFIYCWNEYGKHHKVPMKQAEFIRKAAEYIVRLETARNQDGWQIIGGRLQQLLAADPALNAQYLELKKTPQSP